VEVDRAVAEDAHVDEELRGVEWILVRSPEIGEQIAPDVYLYVNRKAIPRASLFTVMYSFNDKQVEVIRIWIR
jgi:hypothetical protein